MRRYSFQCVAVLFIGVFGAGPLGCAHDPVVPYELTGIWHAVQSGDTAESVSSRYGADPKTVAEVNDLAGIGTPVDRDEIFVPKKTGSAPGDGTSPSRLQVVSPKVQASSPERRGQCDATARSCLEWPVQGKIASGFGSRQSGHHDGIDILAKRGTPIRSAEDGIVLYSGSEIKGYGNLVIIRHEDSVLTVYAHNEENTVSEGDAVKRGDIVAKVGASGSVKDDLLHFEVRVGEQPTDPMMYLQP